VTATVDNEMLGDFPLPAEMSAREKALRDTFVAEYLIDYSQVKAAMRCGFPREFAIEWGQKLMEEPYVQKKLTQLEMTPMDEKAEFEYNRQRIKQQLMKEAYYKGPGSSHAARVSALAKLAVIYDLEAPKKSKIDVNHRGGVMQVPPVAGVDDWESAALASQEALMNGQ
jgi:hypothetical protein